MKPVTHAEIVELLNKFTEAKLDFIKTENLCTFNGEKAFSN
jgi:isocitrate dehydrogenase